MWIVRCIQSSSFFFNVNEEVKGYIRPSRGIRQGYPLSPYLFLICTEAFTNLIQRAMSRKEQRRRKISKAVPKLTHLLFADDLLLFCETKVEQIKCLKTILLYYEKCSGQQVNSVKSSIFFSKNSLQQMRVQFCQEMEEVEVQTKAKYLWSPLVIGRSKAQVFRYIEKTTVKRISSWKNKFISTASKETLLKSVVMALPIYSKSCYKVSKQVCK